MPLNKGDGILRALPAMITNKCAWLKKAQDRYKSNLVRTVHTAPPINPGNCVYVNRAPDAARTDADRKAEVVM